jgi:signal transduction histidine kinase
MSEERLLSDIFLLLDACLAASEARGLDALAEALVERMVHHLGAATGLVFVHDPARDTVEAYPEARARLMGTYARQRPPSLGIEQPRVWHARVGAFVVTLAVPASPHVVLELYARDADVFPDRTARVLSSLAPWLGAQVDVALTARRAAEAVSEARAAREALDHIVGSIPGVVWRFDGAGRPTYVSPRAVERLGVVSSDPAHPRERGLYAADRARVADELRVAERARLTETTLTYRYTHGASRVLLDLEERVSLAFDGAGALVSVTGLVTDVTAARAAHRRLEELTTQRTADARADAQRLDAARATHAKSEFLNLLSHELRAPLFPIIALSDLLLRTEDTRMQPHELREQVRMINGAGKQMLQLVGDLLDISRIDAGRARPNPGPIALHHFVAAIADRSQERARARGTKLSIELVPSPSGTDVYTDRSVLERIATALIGHAVESLECRDIRVRVRADEAAITLTLVADAPPPPQLPEDPDDVFEPFWERPTEARAEARGQGLALTLARRLALAFGGRARATIEPERRTFEVEIPCAYPGPRPFAKVPRAVFVSGELGAVFGGALLAQAMGADVRIVGSAGELVEDLRKVVPDLLFVDARLPGLRLVEDALRAERAQGQYRPRVVALTRPSEPFAVASAVADEVVSGPLTRERVATILARF